MIYPFCVTNSFFRKGNDGSILRMSFDFGGGKGDLPRMRAFLPLRPGLGFDFAWENLLIFSTLYPIIAIGTW